MQSLHSSVSHCTHNKCTDHYKRMLITVRYTKPVGSCWDSYVLKVSCVMNPSAGCLCLSACYRNRVCLAVRTELRHLCVFVCLQQLSQFSSFHQQVWRGQCLLLPRCHTCSLPLKLVQYIEHVRFRHYTDLLMLRWWQSCKCYWWTAGWLWKESSWTTKVWWQQHEKV